MKAYINYPQPHITIHRSADCAEFQKQHKSNQRFLVVNASNIKQVLMDFANDKYRFGPSQKYNDLWLDISLETPNHEEGFVYVIHSIVSVRYTRFQNAPFNYHC